MKRILLLSTLFAVGMFLFSCKKLSEVTFELAPSDLLITVDSTSQTGTYQAADVLMAYDLDAILNANKVKKDKIKSIKAKMINVSIEPGQTVTNFDAVSAFDARLYASGIGEGVIASKNPVPAGTTSMDLATNSTDFANYLKSGNVYFRTILNLTAPIPAPTTIRVKVKFTVVGDVLK